MNDILQEIITHKRIEVERQKQAVPLSVLLSMSSERMDRPTVSMRKSLAESSSGIIAEFKRKSPSKGWIHFDAKIEDVLPKYEAGGASACSILTDEKFFGGSFADIVAARRSVHLPLLRKDFIVDEYQVYQARALGADAILLIAAALTTEKCRRLAALAHENNLETLLEIHSEEEIAHLNPDIDMLGVNNRHLGSFHTDVATSFNLAERLKSTNTLIISESGISDANIVGQLRQSGYRGFLIGENFMKNADPGDALATFIRNIPC
jgi:indole-3-glycerol phosphate synthase